jgi:hypothetical protein
VTASSAFNRCSLVHGFQVVLVSSLRMWLTNLNLGCRLKTVVSFEFYLSDCTNYSDCLQLVIVIVFSASYPRLIFSHIVKNKIGTLSLSWRIRVS